MEKETPDSLTVSDSTEKANTKILCHFKRLSSKIRFNIKRKPKSSLDFNPGLGLPSPFSERLRRWNLKCIAKVLCTLTVAVIQLSIFAVCLFRGGKKHLQGLADFTTEDTGLLE